MLFGVAKRPVRAASVRALFLVTSASWFDVFMDLATLCSFSALRGGYVQ
jgi:hypothetical protein